MAPLAFEFFFRLLLGWNFFLIFISRQESSEKFLRVSARFSMVFAVIALISAGYSGFLWHEYLPVSLLFLSSLTYLSRSSLTFRIFAVAIILFSPLLLLQERSWVFLVNMWLSSLVLGGAFVGQFLGHWYLNVPNIHIREFKRITNMALGSIVVRALWLVFIFYFFGRITNLLPSGDFFDLEGNYWRGLSAFGSILLASRVLWGIVAPLLLTWMAKKTVDMRSTQSATGIFYANSVLMLLGELCALYLEKELKWPI